MLVLHWDVAADADLDAVEAVGEEETSLVVWGADHVSDAALLARVLAEALPRVVELTMRSSRKIKARGPFGGDSSCTALHTAFTTADASRLRKVSFIGLDLRAASAVALVPTIPASVDTFAAEATRLSLPFLHALAAHVCHAKSGISHVSLDDAVCGDDGAAAMAPALRGLDVLELSQNEIGDAGALALASALGDADISLLDLSANDIGEAGMEAIRRAAKDGGIVGDFFFAGNPGAAGRPEWDVFSLGETGSASGGASDGAATGGDDGNGLDWADQDDWA